MARHPAQRPAHHGPHQNRPVPKNVHSSSDFDRFDPQLDDSWIGQRAALYDSTIYAAAGQPRLSFYSQQIGSGTSWVGSGTKNYSDTNMELQGQLPRGKQFLVQSIEVLFYPIKPAVAHYNPEEKDSTQSASLVNDVYTVMTSGSLRFFIGSADIVWEAPLMRFPAKTKFDIHAALSDTTTAGSNQLSWIAFAQASGRPYILHPYDELLTDGLNFGIEIEWEEGAQALPSGQTARIFTVLDGVMRRRPQ